VEKETMEKQEENKTYGHLANSVIIVCIMMMFLPIYFTAKEVVAIAITATLTN
jgi:hypothetical protein